MDWTCAPTPHTSLAAITVYDEWINRRLDGACNNMIPLTPSVSRVIEKRNKAQNIIVLQGVLSHEELEKRKAEELRKAKHKKEGSQCRVKTLHSIIRKGDALLRIARRKEYLKQCRAIQQQELQAKIDKLGGYQWGVTARAAARWSKQWQERDVKVRHRYYQLLVELIHFHKTGDKMLIEID
jgi:hypothetical protein